MANTSASEVRVRIKGEFDQLTRDLEFAIRTAVERAGEASNLFGRIDWTEFQKQVPEEVFDGIEGSIESFTDKLGALAEKIVEIKVKWAEALNDNASNTVLKRIAEEARVAVNQFTRLQKQIQQTNSVLQGDLAFQQSGQATTESSGLFGRSQTPTPEYQERINDSAKKYKAILDAINEEERARLKLFYEQAKQVDRARILGRTVSEEGKQQREILNSIISNGGVIVDQLQERINLEMQLQDYNELHVQALLDQQEEIGKVIVKAESGLRTAQQSVGRQQLRRRAGLGGSGYQTYGAMIDISRIIQDAPYGLIGIANNMDPLVLQMNRLKAETNGWWAAIKAVGKDIGTTAGGLTLLVSLLSSIGVIYTQNIWGFKDWVHSGKSINEEFKKLVGQSIEYNQLSDEQLKVAGKIVKEVTKEAEKKQELLEIEQSILQGREENLRRETGNLGASDTIYSAFEKPELFLEREAKGEIEITDQMKQQLQLLIDIRAEREKVNAELDEQKEEVSIMRAIEENAEKNIEDNYNRRRAIAYDMLLAEKLGADTQLETQAKQFELQIERERLEERLLTLGASRDDVEKLVAKRLELEVFELNKQKSEYESILATARDMNTENNDAYFSVQRSLDLVKSRMEELQSENYLGKMVDEEIRSLKDRTDEILDALRESVFAIREADISLLANTPAKARAESRLAIDRREAQQQQELENFLGTPRQKAQLEQNFESELQLLRIKGRLKEIELQAEERKAQREFENEILNIRQSGMLETQKLRRQAESEGIQLLTGDLKEQRELEFKYTKQIDTLLAARLEKEKEYKDLNEEAIQEQINYLKEIERYDLVPELEKELTKQKEKRVVIDEQVALIGEMIIMYQGLSKEAQTRLRHEQRIAKTILDLQHALDMEGLMQQNFRDTFRANNQPGIMSMLFGIGYSEFETQERMLNDEKDWALRMNVAAQARELAAAEQIEDIRQREDEIARVNAYYKQKELNIEAKHLADMAELRTAMNRKKVEDAKQFTTQFIGNLAEYAKIRYDIFVNRRKAELLEEGKTEEQANKIIEQEGKKKLRIQKALAKAQILVAGTISAMEAFKSVMESPIPMSPIARTIAASALAASVMAVATAKARQVDNIDIGSSSAGTASGGTGKFLVNAGQIGSEMDQRPFLPETYGTPIFGLGRAQGRDSVGILVQRLEGLETTLQNVLERPIELNMSPEASAEMARQGDRYVAKTTR